MRERFADADGRMRATFEIVWLSGWAPHESQQKPLKPGLGDDSGLPMRSDAREISAGEKPRAVKFRKRLLTAVQSAVTLPPSDGDRADQHGGDAGGDHRVFDRGCAALRRRRKRRSLRISRSRRIGLILSPLGGLNSSAIRCAISGTSAGGIVVVAQAGSASPRRVAGLPAP